LKNTDDDDADINGSWGIIGVNVKDYTKMCLGYYELKEHKPTLDERRPELSDQRKPAKLQWSQDRGQLKEDNLNNVRREAYRYFRKKRMNVRKKKINDLATNSKNKNFRNVYGGITEFKNG
jgi:hypothetical protein